MKGEDGNSTAFLKRLYHTSEFSKEITQQKNQIGLIKDYRTLYSYLLISIYFFNKNDKFGYFYK